MFNACAQLGTAEALNLVKKVSNQMPKSYHSNPRLLTSLLDALMKCGDIESAQLLFDTTRRKPLPMYGAMMNGFNKANNPSQTLNLFSQIKHDNFVPDIVI